MLSLCAVVVISTGRKYRVLFFGFRWIFLIIMEPGATLSVGLYVASGGAGMVECLSVRRISPGDTELQLRAFYKQSWSSVLPGGNNDLIIGSIDYRAFHFRQKNPLRSFRLCVKLFSYARERKHHDEIATNVNK